MSLTDLIPDPGAALLRHALSLLALLLVVCLRLVVLVLGRLDG